MQNCSAEGCEEVSKGAKLIKMSGYSSPVRNLINGAKLALKTDVQFLLHFFSLFHYISVLFISSYRKLIYI